MADERADRTAYADEQLTRWREAVLARGLPEPSRGDRWQVLRAGVVNLWEFEEAEYWYADGWVQLTGRNETGKSSLMALTTLIPWLGDTSTVNIDTLGGSGKQFRYYVEPTTLDGDRRDATSSTSRGWLWVEYARIGSAGDPEFFTTLGYAEARRASATLTPRWCTVQGSARVRAGLDLVEARTVRSPRDVHESLAGAAGRFVLPHGSGAAYRTEVAQTLLDAEVERLETVGKMLRVARTPKLGESLNASFVTEKLRDALPGLERTEVEALAEGWDQLDRARRDLTLARENVEALRQFVNQAWMPYARARLRQGADAAAAARSAFDGVTRRVRESTDVLTTAQADVSRLVTAIADAQARADSAREQREAHLQSRAYLDAQSRAQNLEHKAAESARARAALAVATADLAGHEEAVAAAAAEVTVAEEKVDAHAVELGRFVAAVLEQAATAGVRAAKDLAVERDWTRLGRAIDWPQGRSGAARGPRPGLPAAGQRGASCGGTRCGTPRHCGDGGPRGRSRVEGRRVRARTARECGRGMGRRPRCRGPPGLVARRPVGVGAASGVRRRQRPAGRRGPHPLARAAGRGPRPSAAGCRTAPGSTRSRP